MTGTRGASSRVWAVLVLLLAAVLTLTGTAGNASAAPGSTNENRVKAFNAAVLNGVGAGEDISAGQRRGEGLPQLRLAQGRGVHTYYVLAGSEPVLAHNANGCPLYKTRDVDEYGRRITNAPPAPNWQADELAAYLGYSPTGKVYGGQEAYKRGNNYIIQDTSSHKGGFWKMADDPEKFRSRGSRLRQGTYDFLLNPVGK